MLTIALLVQPYACEYIQHAQTTHVESSPSAEYQSTIAEPYCTIIGKQVVVIKYRASLPGPQ